MILHLGSDVAVQTSEIIALIDLTRKQSSFTGEMLSQVRRHKRLLAKQGIVPKSAVILAGARKPGGTFENPRVYLSALSAATLAQRTEHPFEAMEGLRSFEEPMTAGENERMRENGEENG